MIFCHMVFRDLKQSRYLLYSCANKVFVIIKRRSQEMDTKVILATKSMVKQYSDQALQSFESKRNKILDLFNNKKLPEHGWNEADIEILLQQIAMMDSNNFSGNCGVGEREARFASSIVARRHFRMGHGIGRSGDLCEIQPKAAGSSLMNILTNEFVLEIIKTVVGSPNTKKCLLVPMATGMSLVLCLRTLHSKRSDAKYVIWSRIDQKSCFKCILTAGLIPLIIDGVKTGEQLTTDLEEIENTINRTGCNNIVCILTTTSCFAPRGPDQIVCVGEICSKYDIPHLINNAYGLQCPQYMMEVEEASKHRVDVYVSSTDKNFMVPVGGSIIAGYDENLINDISKMYPGRASATPTMDVFITLLNIGKSGYKRLILERKEMLSYLRMKMEKVAKSYKTTVLNVPDNEISIGFSLQLFQDLDDTVLTEIGSMLFSKFVSGTRVVTPGETKTIGGYKFCNWGAHSDSWSTSYLTAAATIGITKEDIDLFTKRLNDVLSKVKKHALHC